MILLSLSLSVISDTCHNSRIVFLKTTTCFAGGQLSMRPLSTAGSIPGAAARGNSDVLGWRWSSPSATLRKHSFLVVVLLLFGDYCFFFFFLTELWSAF